MRGILPTMPEMMSELLRVGQRSANMMTVAMMKSHSYFSISGEYHSFIIMGGMKARQAQLPIPQPPLLAINAHQKHIVTALLRMLW
jgi:hypothetical protein